MESSLHDTVTRSSIAMIPFPARVGIKSTMPLLAHCFDLLRVIGHLLQKATCAAAAQQVRIFQTTRFGIFNERCFARSTIDDALLWEARHVLDYQLEGCGTKDPMGLSLGEIDRYLNRCAMKLMCNSLKL